MTEFTLIDVALIVVVAALVALCAKKKLVGLFVGLGAALLLRPLLSLGQSNAYLAVALALAAGVALALFGRRLVSPSQGPNWPLTVLGGFGGVLLGFAMLFALITSLPIQRVPANQNAIYYPPQDINQQLAVTLRRSPLILMGRSILLYPLLPVDGFSNLQQRVYSGLHGWLVIGEPWLGR